MLFPQVVSLKNFSSKNLLVVLSCALVAFTSSSTAHATPRRRALGPVSIASFGFLNGSNNRLIKTVVAQEFEETFELKQTLPSGFVIRANMDQRGRPMMVQFALTAKDGSVIRGTSRHFPYAFNAKLKSGKPIVKDGTYQMVAVPYTKESAKEYVRGKAAIITLDIDAVGVVDRTTVTKPSTAIPSLALWQTQMLSYGLSHCRDLQNTSRSFDNRLADTYYDAEWVFYQIADYTHDSSWNACAQAAASIYREGYVAVNNGVVPGYWNFSHGLTQEYLRTGSQRAKAIAILLSLFASYAPDWTPLSWTTNANLSREVAYAIMSYLNAETLGQPHRARTEKLVAQALNHLDQWFVSRTADYVRPFMFALTAHALISYNDQIGGNTKILPALKQGADWIWDNTWLPNSQAFKYTDRNVSSGGTDAAPDLNLLIAPVYAWIWHQTGDETYRDRADKIFVGGVKNAWLGNGKQFDQNYRWSFDYVKWRSTPPLN